MAGSISVKHVQVRLTEEEHAALGKLAGKAGIQAFVRSILSAHLTGEVAGYPYDLANRVWHDRLERILVEGSERDRIGIEQNIEWAVRSIGPARPQKRKAG